MSSQLAISNGHKITPYARSFKGACGLGDVRTHEDSAGIGAEYL
jgi:hypothetical protein